MVVNVIIVTIKLHKGFTQNSTTSKQVIVSANHSINWSRDAEL